MPSDRKKIKDQEKGVFGTTGLSTASASVAELHEETFTFEISADAALAEIGMCCEKAFMVKRVRFTPSTALAAHGSNYVTYDVQKRDGAGGAAVSVATTNTNSAGANVSLAQFVPFSFTLTTTAANKKFAVGNVLTVKSAETGTPTSPIGILQVTVEYGAE